ncbi:hypothetical protein CLOM_g16457 [Closterium sp. NIES-68]|nr:hypothetical protein CLOM_g16457 [Closterium sp. NIES-68]GJP58218.1 hypothetical protein CLOP_g22687 [Closterium sp. NIES-67]
MRVSGIQREVFALYRRLLRAARSKPPQEAAALHAYLKSEFRRTANSVGRTEIGRIEYLLRRGEKQVELLTNPSTTGISLPQQQQQQQQQTPSPPNPVSK